MSVQMADVSQRSRQLSWASFAGPVAVVVAAVAAVWVAWNRATGDFTHMLEPMQRLLAGEFSEVYTITGFGTSLSAWLALTVVPFMVGRTVSDDPGAWVLAGLVAVPMLVASVRFAVRAINPEVSVARAWLLAGLAAILPTTLTSWTEYYHPQDVAGAALVVFALGFAAKRQWMWSGLLFGFAALTRQWALLVALLVAPLTRTRRDFLTFAGTGAVVAAAGFLPWVLLGNDGVFAALTGSRAAVTGHTWVGRLVGGDNKALLSAVRMVPLLVAAGIAAWMTLKKKGNLYWLAPLAVTAMGLRMLFDVAAYTYYWAPICIFLLLIRGPKWVTPIVTVAASTVAWLVYPQVASSGQLGSLLTAVWVPVIIGAFVLVAWWLNDDTPPTVETSPSVSPTPRALWLVAAAVVVGVLGVGLHAVTVDENENPSNIISEDLFPGYGTVTVTGAPLVADPTGNITGTLPQIDAKDPNGNPVVIAPGMTRAIVISSHWCGECRDAVDAVTRWAFESGVPIEQVALVGIDADREKGNWPPELWLLSLGWQGPAALDDPGGQLKAALGNPTAPTIVFFDPNGTVTGVVTGKVTAQTPLPVP